MIGTSYKASRLSQNKENMKYNFYNKSFVCMDYRRGMIFASARKVDEAVATELHDCPECRAEYLKEFEGKYLIEFFYTLENSKYLFFLDGEHYDDGSEETIQTGIKEFIEWGDADKMISDVESELCEWMDFKSYREEEMKREGNQQNFNDNLKLSDRLN